MGANTFIERGQGSTAQAAFTALVSEAQWEYGHGGYTGTIAEKHDFVMIPLPEDEADDPEAYADLLLSEDDPRISDKWGPAGCIQTGPETFLFFGWASS